MHPTDATPTDATPTDATLTDATPTDATPTDATPTDATPTAWYHDGVHWALEEGVLKGVSDNKFAPDTPTSRAMIVTMLYRMEGEPKTGKKATFKDVPAGKYYTKAVNWAFENDIVNGYDADTFGPNDNLTREQLVTILERYAKYKGMDVSKGEQAYLTGFTDADIARLRALLLEHD